MKKFIYSKSGFSLFEVLVAISVFSIFFVVFSSSFFHNRSASIDLNEELKMSTLAQTIIKDVLVELPPLTESLNKSNKKQNFEDPNLKDYSYTIEWSRLEFPNLVELNNMANQGEDNNQNKSMINSVFKYVQEATKDVLWQLRVTVLNASSQKQYPITTWVKNPQKQISIGNVKQSANDTTQTSEEQ